MLCWSLRRESDAVGSVAKFPFPSLALICQRCQGVGVNGRSKIPSMGKLKFPSLASRLSAGL